MNTFRLRMVDWNNPAFYIGTPNCPSSLCTPRAVRVELHDEGLEAAGIDGVAHVLHQLQVVMQVVDRVEPGAEDFAGAVQVIQVGARKVATCITAAAFVERLVVVLVAGILDLDVTETGEDP